MPPLLPRVPVHMTQSCATLSSSFVITAHQLHINLVVTSATELQTVKACGLVNLQISNL